MAQQDEIRALIAAGPDLPTAAWGCKNGGFTSLECAPQLHTAYPAASAAEIAAAIVRVWACETSASVLQQSLTACNAWSSAEITTASASALSLTWYDLARFKASNLMEVGLFQGDLTAMSSAEHVSVLVISALPGDYTPTPGSMIAALAAKGVSVGDLAKTPAVDMRQQHKCWLSQSVQGQDFDQLLVLETSGAEAAANIPGLFAGLATAVPSPPANMTVASALLSTGSAGAQPADVLTALFNGAKASMEGGYGLTGLKVVVFKAAWISSLVTKFDELKGAGDVA
jgi:hypothetical protein